MTADDPSLVAGNEFDADGGHWASWLATNGRLVIDGRIVGNGFRGVHVKWPWTISILGDSHVVWFNRGTQDQTHHAPPRANSQRLSNLGEVTTGHFWDVHRITPDGSIIDITMTPWRREGVSVLVNGWSWSSTESSSGKLAVIGMPARPFATGVFDAVIIDGFGAA
ncbi:MAG: hypothetical protein ACHQX3_05635, partial [Nitrospirales bacterium]